MRYPYDVRIIGGVHRSRKIKIPEDKSIWPTANRSREAVFNMLSQALNGQSIIPSANVLDVFAGTGAFGLECLSRGADHATFIDITTTLLEENVRALGESDKSTIIKSDVKQLDKYDGEAFDIIFMDPPFESGLLEPSLKLLKERGWIRPGAMIVAQSPAKDMYKTPADFNVFDERVYGQFRFNFMITEAA